uniref:Putative secreted protein n=1 Tax=Anopheles darlingi TaxID=43151 RepID=A0A2M4DDK8_ANODA
MLVVVLLVGLLLMFRDLFAECRNLLILRDAKVRQFIYFASSKVELPSEVLVGSIFVYDSFSKHFLREGSD